MKSHKCNICGKIFNNRKSMTNHKRWHKYKHPLLGKHRSKKAKEKISQANKGKHYSPKTEFKKGQVPWNKGKIHPKMRKLWQNPNYRKNTRKAILKALIQRPNKPEQKLIDIIEKYNLPYEYTGDGKFILDGKCPDFLNCNGEKKVIEVFGKPFHNPKKTFRKHIPFHQTEWGTKLHYHKHGFECVIIWENQISNLSDLEIINLVR